MGQTKIMMDHFKKALGTGELQKAYRHLMDVFSSLQTALRENKEAQVQTGTLYHGYLDMTYLPVTTRVLRKKGMKVAVVFDYPKFQFQLWLSAGNRKKREKAILLLEQTKVLKDSIRIAKENPDAILEQVIHEPIDFEDTQGLVRSLVAETIRFTKYAGKMMERL